SPPISEYLLFEAQPARTNPYTPSDVNAKTYNSPTFIRVTWSSIDLPNRCTWLPYGITTSDISAATIATAGAARYTARFAWSGTMSSLKIILSPSAKGWRSPHTPTRFGPTRSWIQLMTLRSTSVR